MLSSINHPHLRCRSSQSNKMVVSPPWLLTLSFNKQRTHECLAILTYKIISPWLGVIVSSDEQKFGKVTARLRASHEREGRI